ncbi:NUDIX domain-containing protein [Chryseolinea lacunae]|uniref:GDP-mannose pyrophosphatase n=1 Tax=Chryseolinea lacunae TaxID=2801331 RepID=A0ABS1L014_9BACT|nr:NUDIX hydrolase [Chryseolinea lacunae]MBL0745050.1 NUDIX hydrolase [Chryseolinea lacunae]
MAQNEIENPWTTLSSEDKYENPWIKVTEHQVINPAGGNGIYGKVHFKNKAIGIVALDEENNTWLVGQYRYTLNEFHWEIPEGGGAFTVDPELSARRELQEETGLTAQKWTRLFRIHTSNSATDEEGFVFLAEELQHGDTAREETEADMKVRKLPLRDAVAMVMRGEITDAISMAGLLAVARLKGI